MRNALSSKSGKEDLSKTGRDHASEDGKEHEYINVTFSYFPDALDTEVQKKFLSELEESRSLPGAISWLGCVLSVLTDSGSIKM